MMKTILAATLYVALSMLTSCSKHPICRISATDATIAIIHLACEKYKVDTGSYPSTKLGLDCLVSNPGVDGWKGPYIIREMKDVWGGSFKYELQGTNVLIVSAGPDGQFGTADDKDGRQ